MKQRLFITSMLCALFSTTQAQPMPSIQGTSFFHHDWELACDNTGTCRAAGYPPLFPEEDTLPISILLTRHAGADQPVSGQFSLADSFDEDSDNFLSPQTFQLWIGNRNHGTIHYQQNPSPLNTRQVQALLAAAKTNQTIAFVNTQTQQRGIISGQGMSATLLKMDDFQRRVGTLGAIIRPGTQPETHILQPQPTPVVVAQNTLENDETLQQYYADKQNQLIALTKDDYTANCTFEEEQEDGTIQTKPMNFWDTTTINTYPLNNAYALFEHSCWSAAYNYGNAYWLVDKNLTTAALITTEAVGYDQGQIVIYQKGRGIGDCHFLQTYTWDGNQFILTRSGTSGMCRGQLGGFWWLPTTDYDVKHKNNDPL